MKNLLQPTSITKRAGFSPNPLKGSYRTIPMDYSFPLRRDRPPAPSPRLQYPWLRVGTIAIALFPTIVVLSVSQGHRSFPFPPCLFQAWFGFPAPSCGLTRSFLALAQGNWALALEYHLFGPLLALLTLWIAGVALGELITQRCHTHLYRWLLRPRFAIPFVGCLLVYYALRLWARYTLPILPWGWSDTALWQHFLAGAQAL